MANILVCDDDSAIVNAISIYLKAEGFNVLMANDGKQGLEIVENEAVDCAIIDIMMPKMDGIELVNTLRSQKQHLPIIILSAKSQDEDKILGLNIGADDYMSKPFQPLELVARVKSQLRRYQQFKNPIQESDDIIQIRGLMIDDNLKQVTLHDEIIKLTPIEYQILLYLARHPKRVFSSEQIYQAIWKDEPLGYESTVAVHIRHIREKIEANPKKPEYIKVVWGVGYKLEVD